MYNDEILAAIAAARESGSFKLRIVFTPLSEIGGVRSFVAMLRGGGISVDDGVMMKLRLVAFSRKWQEDTDRVVVMAMGDNFDESEFAAKFEFAIESIEALPRDFPLAEQGSQVIQGGMDIKTAIRRAEKKNLREFMIVLQNATRGDVALLMDVFRHGYFSFTNPVEQKVFEEAVQDPKWSLGGKLSAIIRIEGRCHEHIASAAMLGAHARARTIRVMR